MKRIVMVILLLFAVSVTNAQQISPEQAAKTADSLNKILAVTNNPLQRFNIINKLLLNDNGFSGKVDSALCIQQLQIAEELQSDSLLGTAYNWIGTYFSLNKGDNSTAMEYFFKGIPFAEKANDKRRISSLYFDLALVYTNIQNNEELLKYTRKGGENLPAASHPLYNYMLAQYLRCITTYFIRNNQPDSALHYAQAAEENGPKANSLVLEFAAHRLTAATYALAGEGMTSTGGLADLNKDGRITLDEWLRYAVQRLPSLSADVRLGKLASARGFDLGPQRVEAKPQEPALFDFTGKPSPTILRTGVK